MRSLFTNTKKRINAALSRRTLHGTPTKKISIEEATRITVQRYGDALRNLADR